MTMRCVSKCFIGRSFRVYSVLFLGVIVGFSISTMLQTFTLQRTRSSAHKLQQVVDYRALDNSKRVEFSNLEGQYEQDINIGDYDYERMALGDQDRAAQDAAAPPDKRGEERPAMFDGPAVRSQREGNSVHQRENESRLKQRQYRSESWHGRNVRETNEQGFPPNKLTDELPTRQAVLISVITSVNQLMSQTLAIQGTWAPEATQVIFFVGEVQTMPHLPHGMHVIQLEGIDDGQAGWEVKEFKVIQYLIEHYLDHVDWNLVVSDEAYVVPNQLERQLNLLDASMPAYLGIAGEQLANGRGLGCVQNPGIVYSRGLLEKLKLYLPVCSPGQGEADSLKDCIGAMNVKCTQSFETHLLFVSDANLIVDTSDLFSRRTLSKALVLHPVKYPKFMYRLHSYFKELEYNNSMGVAKAAAGLIHSARPFIPAHLRSPFQIPLTDEKASSSQVSRQQAPPVSCPPAGKPEVGGAGGGGVTLRPRHVPKNKFEINYWEYFNQTRLMSIMNESPARGIIGGIREEARYALTKAIYLANQGVPQSQRYVFDKLENGYHRIDAMRGSEFILDFVFRRQADRSTRIRKRLSILRPFHETVVPVDAPEGLPTINFIVVLSGLSHRLEHFMKQYERNVLQFSEDATLTIVLFETPDATKVRLLVQQYVARYQGAKIVVIDTPGDFARGVGLHKGVEKFEDDQLLFFVDVDLDISNDFLQRCRLNTIRTKQVYFPVFFKLYNQDFVRKYHRGNSSMLISRHQGHWAHYSYGMVCIYAADYRRSGGFDLEMKGWGEEDVDLLNRVLEKGIEVFRAPDPGLIHNWHRKVCDKTSVTNKVAYEHCLQSKGENLADRIELAQYVFEKESERENSL